MASVNWEKIHMVGEMKRKARHCDKDCRLKDNHSNEHINKKLTPYNVQMFDYETTCKRIDDRIEYLDSLQGQNNRKDRVIGFGLEIPIPDGIPDEKVVEFLNKANKIITNQIGSQNMIASYLHIDEVHDYIDAHTKQERTSMRHGHTLVTAAINGKLNGREMSKQANMTKLNKAIDKMCREDYGVAFLTGEKSKSNESVESLKLKSKALELDERENLVEQREEAVAHDEREVEEREKAVAQRESDLEAYDRITHRKREEAEKKLSEANSLMQEAKRREASAKQAENAMVIQNAALQNRADALEEAENELEERKRNFNAEVRKAAEKMLEREKAATATLKQLESNEKINNQLSKLPNFGNDEE